MTQNAEQNVRTREDREQVIAILLCKARGSDPFQMTYQTIEPGVMEPYGEAWCHYLDEAKAVLDWHEAEQRRKDAEGQEPFAYVDPADIEQLFVRLGSADIEIRKTAAWSYTQPIYTRPANVAALEAQVKELENALTEAASALEQVKDGERGGYNARNGKFVSLQMSDGERADIIHSDVTAECERALEIARPFLTREGGA